MSFTLRKVHSPDVSFGKKLMALRRDRGYNIEQVAQATHLKPQVIRAFESDHFSCLPESVYARHFLRSLVRFLRGDEAYFIECFDQGRGTCDLLDPLRAPRKKVRRALFIVTPRIFSFLAIGITCGLIVTYFGFEIVQIVRPPQIEVTAPLEGTTTTQAIMTVQGQVFEQADVFVEGKQVLLDQEGKFRTEVDLQRGLNFITIEAKKRYSKTSIVYRRVMFDAGGSDLGMVNTPIDSSHSVNGSVRN